MGETRLEVPSCGGRERLVKDLGEGPERFLVQDTNFARGKAVGEETERQDALPLQGVEDGEAVGVPESDVWSEDKAVV